MVDNGGRDLSNATIRQVLDFVRRRTGDDGVARTLALAHVDRPVAELEDVTAWSSYDEARRIFEAAGEVLGGSHVLKEIATVWDGEAGVPEVVALFQSFGSIEAFLHAIEGVARKLTTVHLVHVAEVGDESATLVAENHPGFPRYRALCDFTAGLLSIGPLLFGHGTGSVEELECVVDGAPRCLYRVTWSNEPDPEHELKALRTRVNVLTARFESLRDTVADLVSNEDLDSVLRRITERAALTVRAPQYLLAVRLGPDAPLHVHSEGVPSGQVHALAADILSRSAEEQPKDRLVVDVVSGRRHYGRLAAMEPGGFLPEERPLLAAYAKLAAAALDGATALEEARRHARETEVQAQRAKALLELSRRLARVDTRSDVASRLADAVPVVVECDRGAVLLHDEEAGVLRVAALHGYPEEQREPLMQTVLTFRDRSLIDRDYLLFTPDSPNEDVAESLRATGVTALVVVPLLAGDRFFGFVAAGVTGDPGGFTMDADRVERLRGLASQAATALQNAELLEQVRHQALHDAHTGLPNARLLADRAERALARARRTGAPVSLVFCDLDRLKKVNDSLGHAFGNRVLEAVANRLRERVRTMDTVARVGGDEFVVLLEGCDEAAAREVAEKLREGFSEPLDVDAHSLFVTASLGVATAPLHGPDFESLLRHADLAMYEAKAQGRDAVVVATADIVRRPYDHLALDTDLHGAIERGELVLRFQPQVNLHTGAVVGAEALVRWAHPAFGVVPPGEFLPLAQESGLIREIDRWVISEVFEVQRRLAAAGVADLRLAVNVSERTLREGDLPEWLARCLAAAALPAHCLEVEITELVATEAVPAVTETIAALRTLGVRLAIDDFGTGASSLARLHDWRFDTLKIDRAFVERIGYDPAPIADTIIALGDSLGVEVVGEGVETHEQAAFLADHGCTVVQGFLFSRPLDEHAFAEFVRSRAVAASPVPG